ncbi:MAG: DUF418 domain-containing protein [Actinomycetota bacterium]
MTTEVAAPSALSGRVTSLDAIRGVAVLGILVMNVASFGLVDTAYIRLDFDGTETALDWLIGVFGEIVVDQKFMGLFSMLFGAGIVLFADRAAMKSSRPILLSLWRNLLLLIFGIAHTLIWEGDVLVIYALCAPILIAARRAPPVALAVVGTALVLASGLAAAWAQTTVDPDGAELGWYWVNEDDPSGAVSLFLLIDGFGRAIGMMLIGVALYRSGYLHGRFPASFYRKVALVGIAVGWAFAALGVAIAIGSDFSNDIALLHLIPNTVGMIPAVLGYSAVIILWDAGNEGQVAQRIRAAGQMALTNYLTQTLLSALVLWVLLDGIDFTRTLLFIWVLLVWAAQLAWSQPWLERFRFGPFEWLWRTATYWRVQPLRRPPADLSAAGVEA